MPTASGVLRRGLTSHTHQTNPLAQVVEWAWCDPSCYNNTNFSPGAHRRGSSCPRSPAPPPVCVQSVTAACTRCPTTQTWPTLCLKACTSHPWWRTSGATNSPPTYKLTSTTTYARAPCVSLRSRAHGAARRQHDRPQRLVQFVVPDHAQVLPLLLLQRRLPVAGVQDVDLALVAAASAEAAAHLAILPVRTRRQNRGARMPHPLRSAVKALPETYDSAAYQSFIQQFGTHYMNNAFIGGMSLRTAVARAVRGGPSSMGVGVAVQ